MFKKQVVKPILWIMLGGVLMLGLSGCRERKNSREWIENKVSEVNRVYPTENLSDLFNEFPEGFKIYQVYSTKENGEDIHIEITLHGNKASQTIKGDLKKSKIMTDPYKETVVASTDVEYQNEQLVFSDSNIAKEIWKFNGFLFQQLTLNKKILSQLDLHQKSYDFITNGFEITYNIKDALINRYFNKAEQEHSKLELVSSLAGKGDYYYSIIIDYNDDRYFRETVSNTEND